MRPTLTGLMVAIAEPLAALALAVRLPGWTICGSTSSEIFWPAFFEVTDVDAARAAESESVAEPVSVFRSRDAGRISASALPASTRRADM